MLVVPLGLGALGVALGVAHPHRVRHDARALTSLERRSGHHWAWAASVALGVGLMAWIGVQVTVLGFVWLQPTMFLVGAALAVLPFAPGPRRDLAARGRYGSGADGPVAPGGITA